MIRLHKKFFFEEEGFRQSNIDKNGTRIGVHFLGLTRERWNDGKSALYEKYESALRRFSIAFS